MFISYQLLNKKNKIITIKRNISHTKSITIIGTLLINTNNKIKIK
jgi:transcription termination factor Rho